MTKRSLRLNLAMVTLIYLSIALVGVTLYFIDPNLDNNEYYALFKDLILFWVAIPAAYLGYCFQRRSAFLLALRLIWSHMLESVNLARQYTLNNAPNQLDYASTLTQLSKSMDEMRGVYKNIKESPTQNGLYPYESLKQIHRDISALGFAAYNQTSFDLARENIGRCWKLIEKSFLREFDRPFTSYPSTPFGPMPKRNLWDTNINLTE